MTTPDLTTDIRSHRLADGAELAYIERGSGRPVVLLHGVLASKRFFERNLDALAEHFHVFALDLRGHGDSTDSQGGNTVPQYARDLEHFLAARQLTGVVAVGWSMGNFVIWDYAQQFGQDSRLAAQVCVSQGPSDLIANGWEHGFTDPTGLRDLLRSTQEDYRSVCAYVATILTKHLPSELDQAWMVDEQLKTAVNTASCVLADQTQRDYREFLSGYPVPTLGIWGRDEQCLPVAAGEWLAQHAADFELVVLEESGHMPMWEQPDEFHAAVIPWIAALPGG